MEQRCAPAWILSAIVCAVLLAVGGCASSSSAPSARADGPVGVAAAEKPVVPLHRAPRARADPHVPRHRRHPRRRAAAGAVRQPGATSRPRSRACAKAGYHGVTMQQVHDAWHRGGKLPRRPVVLSFDDGSEGQVRHALPLLRARGWPGVLNLTWRFLPDIGGASAVRRLVARRLGDRLALAQPPRPHAALRRRAAPRAARSRARASSAPSARGRRTSSPIRRGATTPASSARSAPPATSPRRPSSAGFAHAHRRPVRARAHPGQRGHDGDGSCCAACATCVRSARLRGEALDEHRLAHPAGDAHRLDPVAAVDGVEAVEQRRHDPRAGHAERVAEGDRAAERVELVRGRSRARRGRARSARRTPR